MTWLVTWPGAPMPVECGTEAAAETYAQWLIDSHATETATAYPVLPDEKDQP